MMHKALHPRDDTDRLYVPKKEGERGLVGIEDRVDASIQWLKDYIKSVEEYRLQPPETIQTTRESKEQNKQKTKMRRKTLEWTFRATNKRNLTREIFEMTKERKPEERNWISSNSSTKQRH